MKRLLPSLLVVIFCASCVPQSQQQSLVESTLSSMTLREKVYQMFTVSPEALTGIGTAIQAGETTRKALEQYPVGGVMYQAKNLKSPEQAKELLNNTKTYSSIPPFLSVDEEGGAVSRVADTLGTTKFSPMYEYRKQGETHIYEVGKTLAKDISQFGFNQNYAPVADVWTNPANTVISTRAFSDNPETAATLVSAAVKGLQDHGIIATLKHFPGHGDTAEDSHTGKAYNYKTLEELRTCEFIPFRAGIEAGADVVMCAHITVPRIDSVPATLSSKWITKILRGELGFDGMVITDAMEMKAIADFYPPNEAAVLAIEAGCDMILCPADMVAAAEGVLDAVESGTLSEERINQSVRRILTVKEKYGILTKD